MQRKMSAIARFNTLRRRGAMRLGLIVVVILAAVVTFGIVGLLLNIFERKQEARNPFFRVVELTDETEDPAVWGKNFPLQYDGYLRTVDMVRTRFGGSEAIPRESDEDDPRSVTSQQQLDRVPQLRRMWAGYAFARDFRKARGHAYMLEDQLFTGRQSVPQPGTCMQCHASVYVPMMKAGGGDLEPVRCVPSCSGGLDLAPADHRWLGRRGPCHGLVGAHVPGAAAHLIAPA